MSWMIFLVIMWLLMITGLLVSEWIKGDMDIRRRTIEQAAGGNAETARAIEELRKEVAELRETSTRFDMSFDAAITHLEQRMDRLEQGTTVAVAETQPMTLNQGR